jgi:hypothetical protein
MPLLSQWNTGGAPFLPIDEIETISFQFYSIVESEDALIPIFLVPGLTALIRSSGETGRVKKQIRYRSLTGMVVVSENTMPR